MDNIQTVNTSAAQRPTPRALIRTISLVIVVSMAVYAAMAALANWSALDQTLSSIPTILWLEVTGLSLLSYSVRFRRWQRFLGALGHAIPLARNLEIYLSGFALTLIPGKVGEAIRSIYLRPYGINYSDSLGAFIAERLLDLATVGLLACLAILAFPKHLLGALSILLSCLVLIVLFRSGLLSFMTARLTRRSLGQYTTKTLNTVKFLLSGSRLGKALPLSFLAWTAQGYSLYLIVDSFGYALPITNVIAIYCLSILAGVASFLPGGVGVTEVAIALLLSTAGMSHSDAIVAALLSRGLTLWLAVGIGVMSMGKIAMIARSEQNETTSRAD